MDALLAFVQLLLREITHGERTSNTSAVCHLVETADLPSRQTVGVQHFGIVVAFVEYGFVLLVVVAGALARSQQLDGFGIWDIFDGDYLALFVG